MIHLDAQEVEVAVMLLNALEEGAGGYDLHGKLTVESE